MKRVALFFAILPALCLILAGCGKEGSIRLCVLHTNDIHGHIAPERVEGWKEPSGGAAVLAGCVRELRRERGSAGIPVLLLDAGDIFMGTPEGHVSRGAAVIEVMNAAGYDALTIGNHEFDRGVETLEHLAASASFPFLCANIDGEPPPFLGPFIIREFEGVRVGIIGILTPETPSIVMPGKTGSIRFTEPAPAVARCRDALRERGADVIIVLSHQGLGADMELAGEVEGIDAIIGGHTHTLLESPVQHPVTGTLVCQAGSSGRYLGVLDMEIAAGNRQVIHSDYEIIPLSEGRCPPDAEVQKIVSSWRARAGEQFDEVVGRSSVTLVGSDTGACRLGTMIAESMRAATDARIAFHNSFGIRAPLHRGEITCRDVYTIMPFDNTLYTMELSGEQLIQIVEQSLELDMGTLHYSGLEITHDPEAPRGKRVESAYCGGEAVEPKQYYTVATNSYLAQGGDYYREFTRGRNVRNTGIVDRNAFSGYLREHSPIAKNYRRPSSFNRREK